MSPTSTSRSEKLRTWDESYHELVAHKAKTGTVAVSAKHSKVLQSWVHSQRKNFKEGRLSIDRMKKLERIGFDFSPQLNFPEHLLSWNDRFSELMAYKAKTGTICVSNKHSKVLQSWVHKQRRRFKEGRLSRDRVEKLKAIGFDFSPQSAGPHLEHCWDDRFSELVAHKAKTGSCHVFSQHSKVLQSWVYNQRRNFKEGRLSIDRIKNLERIGFDFSDQSSRRHDHENNWDYNFAALMAHKTTTGNLHVSAQHSKVLQAWVSSQRASFKEGRLSTDRMKKLESIGFDFSSKLERNQQVWDDNFAALKTHQAKTGSCSVSVNNQSLNQWVKSQRAKYKEGILSRDRAEKLEGIGFDFGPQKLVISTNEMLGLLRDFRSEFGHLCVPYDYKIDHDGRVVRLGGWVSNMRRKRKLGIIDEDLKQKLDSMGFVWNPGTAPWKQYPPPRANSNQRQESQIRPDDNLDNGSNNVASLLSSNCAPATTTIDSSDICSPTTIFDSPPRPMQKIFWRPPTPYPMSDDDEACLGS